MADVQIWTSFDPILEWLPNKGLGMGHNITISEKWSQLLASKTPWLLNFLLVYSIVYYIQSANILTHLAQFLSQGLLNFQILGIYGDLKNAFGQSHVGQSQVSYWCVIRKFLPSITKDIGFFIYKLLLPTSILF